MIVTGVATIGLGIQPSAPCQDERRPADCRRHETAKGNLSPMGGVERTACERQGVEPCAHDQRPGPHRNGPPWRCPSGPPVSPSRSTKPPRWREQETGHAYLLRDLAADGPAVWIYRGTGFSGGAGSGTSCGGFTKTVLRRAIAALVRARTSAALRTSSGSSRRGTTLLPSSEEPRHPLLGPRHGK
jgi:hypothetical protein